VHTGTRHGGGGAGIITNPESEADDISAGPDEPLPSLVVFRPPSNSGAFIGVAVTGLAAAVAVLLLKKGLGESTGFHQMYPFLAAAISGAAACLLGYWTYGALTMRYVIDRNALSIRWGNVQQIIPLDRVERLIPGEEMDLPRIEGLNWPGHHVGRGYASQLGDVLFYSGHTQPAEVLYIETPDQTYAISVPNQQLFLESIQQAQTRGALFEQRQAVHRWGIAAQSFWQDAGAIVLALLVAGTFFSVLGFVLHRYPGLPATVALRFPSLGGVTRSAPRSDLLDIPRSGLGFLAIDLVLAILLHSWERMVAYVLLVAGIAIEIGLLIAAAVAVA
jgi:hypothetical protein